MSGDGAPFGIERGIRGPKGDPGPAGANVSGAANLVYATPNGSSGAAALRKLAFLDLETAFQNLINGKQPLSADLTALSAFSSSTGFVVRDTLDSFALRTFQGGEAIGITDPDGIAGNPVINVLFGQGAHLATAGDDPRLPPNPIFPGLMLVDDGSGWTTIDPGDPDTVLRGNAPSLPFWDRITYNLIKLGPGSGNYAPSSSAVKRVRFGVKAGDGGGGSGRQGIASGSGGGRGGAGGGYSEEEFEISALGFPMAYQAGGGGIGGLAQASANTNGNPGGDGVDSFIGPVRATKGGGGLGGSTGSTSNVAAGLGHYGGSTGGSGNAGNVGGASNAGLGFIGRGGVGGGGGGGPGVTHFGGGLGGFLAGRTASGAPGGSSVGQAGAAGISVADAQYGGQGGGGGASGDASGITAGGRGGDGGLNGGSGGGGGGSVTGAPSGRGGNGSSGSVWIWELFT